jgi:hypothetical protein
LEYWKNEGTPYQPLFNEKSNVFGNINFPYAQTWTAADIDMDNDLDIIGAGFNGAIYVLQNTGTSQKPAFQRMATNGLFPGLHWQGRAHLVFIDQDNDLDLDLLVFSDSLLQLYTHHTLRKVAVCTGVSSPNPEGRYGIGDTVRIETAFSTNINFRGKPSLRLNSGGAGEIISRTGENKLAFRYTVQEGENTGRLNYASTEALLTNGPPFSGDSLQFVSPLLPAVESGLSLFQKQRLVIDGTRPQTFFSAPASATANGAEVNIFFSEKIEGLSESDIQIRGGFLTSNLSFIDSAHYRIFIKPFETDSLIRLDVAKAAYQDQAGNDNALPASATIRVDRQPPGIAFEEGVCEYEGDGMESVFLNATEDVNGLSLEDFSLVNARAVHLERTQPNQRFRLDYRPDNGRVRIFLPGGAAQDVAGNHNPIPATFLCEDRKQPRFAQGFPVQDSVFEHSLRVKTQADEAATLYTFFAHNRPISQEEAEGLALGLLAYDSLLMDSLYLEIPGETYQQMFTFTYGRQFGSTAYYLLRDTSGNFGELRSEQAVITSLEETDARAAWVIYPNPQEIGQDLFIQSAALWESRPSAYLIDGQGRLVRHAVLTKTGAGRYTLPGALRDSPGWYVLKIIASDKVFITKILLK